LFLNQLDFLEKWVEREARFPTAAVKLEVLERVLKARRIYERLAEGE